ncbi:phosphoserine phosphatase SerB [Leeia sp. TBRC 13508]|uniref:Phosphoserine phosphatase n=1 Tax=Leeia speluncae TaxID=2884804 RepID=A0ABS8D9L2_9NEIS|nr:phosphoserine phosphatase SerB [Leeia speluncae]MCB6184802.1 phosphoserine phosphatase SerB [Leeia speluncae]
MNLILQSTQAIDLPILQQVAKAACATGVEQPSEFAYRFTGVDKYQKPAVDEICAQLPIDYVFAPAMSLDEFGLVAMDMDSTLITIECIDEIADMNGLKEQVSAITERSMAGELDFSSSLRERVALLAGLDESVLATIYEERLQLQPGAREMLAAVHEQGIKTLLISGGFTYFTRRLQAELGLTWTIANELEIIDGKLTGNVLGDIIDANAKAHHLMRLADDLGLNKEQTIAFGDGANDKAMFEAAGFSVAFRGKKVLKAVASAAFDHVGLDGILNIFPASK